MVIKATKKPVTIQAVEWNGVNSFEIDEFCGLSAYVDENDNLHILTLEGTMRADKGDYIIKGVMGEFYPCKPDIFHKTYDVEKKQ